MPKSPDCEKRRIYPRVPVDVCRKVEKEFGRAGDADKVICFVRALEEATRDVVLDADDYQMIADEVRANEIKYGKINKKSRR